MALSSKKSSKMSDGVCVTSRNKTFYHEVGSGNKTLMIFVHGWPELGIMWEKQLLYFAALGFHAVAPDMRGYGKSTIYHEHADYAVEEAVKDMLELLDYLGHKDAIWVGHDWGAPVVWNIVSHHPSKCIGIANLCVPYFPESFAPGNLIPLVNHKIYPEAEYPAGQWDYLLYYEDNFEKIQSVFEADLSRTFRTLMRSGIPDQEDKVVSSATIRRSGGWFGGADIAPDLPADKVVMPDPVLEAYVNAFSDTGFFGANSWYMNAEKNTAYACQSENEGKIDRPVLFIHAAYDWICETLHSRLGEPMRTNCSDLKEASLKTGHWMVQEKPDQVNDILHQWIVENLKVGVSL
nr:alpha/beta hydrolase [Flavobacterium sp. ASV13]